MKIFCTGADGFLGSHCLSLLLEQRHEVVFATRNKRIGRAILNLHESVTSENLSYVIVEDIAAEGAFDEAVQSDPPFDAVLHMASPFDYDQDDSAVDMLHSSVRETTELLHSVSKYAPTVSRVVITSSTSPLEGPTSTTPDSCSPILSDGATTNPGLTYLGIKKLTEKIAWDFVKDRKAGFSLVTICPSLMYGPSAYRFAENSPRTISLSPFHDLMGGKWRRKLPPSGISPSLCYHWVDVRDVAFAHIQCLSVAEAAGKRFIVSGYACSNADFASIIQRRFPEFIVHLPSTYCSDLPEQIARFDTTLTRDILNVTYRRLEDSVIDTVASLLWYE